MLGPNAIIGIVIVIIILILVVVGIWWLTPSNANLFGLTASGTTAAVAYGNATYVSGEPYRANLACVKGCRSNGKGQFTMGAGGNYNLQYETLSGPATNSCLRYASNKKVAYVLNGNTGTIPISQQDYLLMKNGGIYVNVHTQRYPEGEIAGNVVYYA